MIDVFREFYNTLGEKTWDDQIVSEDNKRTFIHLKPFREKITNLIFIKFASFILKMNQNSVICKKKQSNDIVFSYI